ncbi:MAG: D-2-hydroxyacid dehydrogenase [Planctomycetota bacterium]
MKIVVLDGHTMNPGDLDWAPLEQLGQCAFHERTPPEKTVERSKGAEIVLTNKAVLDRAAIDALPALRYIGVTATGYNVVDLAAARERGIVVTNVPAYSSPSVAQATFALLLELTNSVGHHSRAVSEGRWGRAEDFCFWDSPIVELDGLVMGIVGLGAIGSAVARIAKSFGMTVIAYDVAPREVEAAEFVDLETLFSTSDVISLHCPLTDDTEKLVNTGRLALMKPTAYLVNAARGPLVDETALADALNQGRIAGAALDVLSIEPPRADNPLLKAANCLITPHVAWAARASRQRLMDTVIANVRAFLAGSPVNVV